MNKWRSQKVVGTSQRSIFIIFNVLISVINAHVVLAQYPCYLIDANGKRINLSEICRQSSQKTVTPQNTTSSSPKISPPPDVNLGNNQPTQGNQSNLNSMSRVTGDSLGVNETQETENYRFVPKIQRGRIPLLQ